MSQTLTVVVLTYNSSKTIADCLESLVAQRQQGFSVLIVDDASTDNTIEIVEEYRTKLSLTVTTNGAHNIARGRNIGLQRSTTDLVAFVDSDDTVTPEWTKVIWETFATEPGLALISGTLLPSFRTTLAKAIALNDDVMRSLFGGGIMQFCTCNSAINRHVIPDVYFHEDFVNAEDLEFASRVESQKHQWRYIEAMRVNHETRDTLSRYTKQIYNYGKWKLFFSYRIKQFRAIDYVPLAAGIFFIAGAFITPLSLIGLLGLPAAQTAAVLLKGKPTFSLLPYVALAWSVKNVGWSLGIVAGLWQLITRGATRKTLMSEQLEPNV